jgi:putative sterol carrier protein
VVTDAVDAFFEHVEARAHEPLLDKGSGVLRIDLTRGEQADSWFISIDHGDISVSREQANADCTLRMDHALFSRMATGEANAMAAVLRGEVSIEGDLELVLLLQRLLPGRAAGSERSSGGGGRRP